MFGDRYYGPRYYGNRYFGPGATGAPPAPPPSFPDPGAGSGARKTEQLPWWWHNVYEQEEDERPPSTQELEAARRAEKARLARIQARVRKEQEERELARQRAAVRDTRRPYAERFGTAFNLAKRKT